MQISKATATSAIVGLLGVAGFLVHSTVLFDPDEFVLEHETSVIEEALAGHAPVEETEMARRARWHVGQPPCFTYAPPHATADEIESVVSELAASGSVEAAASNLMLFADWSVADERLRHGDPTEEEMLSNYGDLGWYGRLLLALNRSRILEATFKRLRRREGESRARAAQREAELPQEQVSKLRTTWQTHRLKLPVAALPTSQRALEQRVEGATSR